MADLPPPPPYSLRDPNTSNSARGPLQPQDISAFNAFVEPRAFDGGFAPQNARPAGQTLQQARNGQVGRSVVRPVLTPRVSGVRSPGSANGSDLDKAGFVSASPYFKLRAPSQPRPADTFLHQLIIGPDSEPDSLPFPEPSDQWLRREVDHQDWMTFLNHVFPHHGVENGNSTCHQELEVGMELYVGRLSLGNRTSRHQSLDQSHYLLGGTSGSGSDRAIAGWDREIDQLRRVRIEAVTAQWNAGFFGPRGLELVVHIREASLVSQTEPIMRQNSASNVLQKRPPSEAQETLLHRAVGNRHKSTVKLLLAKGDVDIEALNKKGETALFRAVSHGEKAIVELLLENGANPLARPLGGQSPLYICAYNDRKTIMKYLLEKSRLGIDEQASTGETPLYVAVQRHYTSCVELLLDHGANPNARPVGGESMINISVRGDLKSITKLLLRKGVDLEENNKNGETPLAYAVSRGNKSMTQLLLDHGASVAARTSKREALLSAAVARGDSSIVSMLLTQKNVDVEVENLEGETPLYKAVSRSDNSIAEQLLRKGANANTSPPQKEKILNLAVSRGSNSLTYMLLERGVDFEDRNKSGETPLFHAVGRSDTSIVSLLLAKGADANTQNLSGETALSRAVYRAATSIVSLLLSYGANPEFPSSGGEAPLFHAVSRSKTSIVSLLLAHGANPDAKSPSGEAPLAKGVSMDSTAIVSLLLGKGANPEIFLTSGESLVDYAVKRGNKNILQLLRSYSPPKPPSKD